MNLSRLKQVLRYDEDTGLLYWTECLSPVAQVGAVAGTLQSSGYITVGLDGKILRAHRIAWALHYDELPPKFVDHKNRVRSDNRIDNLRASTVVSNAYNQGLASNNKSGVKGVCWDNTKQMWRVMGSVDGKRKRLGYFEDLTEASQVMHNFRLQNHGEFAND
jgi:hypothetical protein